MTFQDMSTSDIKEIATRSIDNFSSARKSIEHKEALLALRDKRKPKFHDQEHMKKIKKSKPKSRQ
jgi:hypothetical protein